MSQRFQSPLWVNPPPIAETDEERKRVGRIQAFKDAVMLDTSVGQATMMTATAKAFDVPVFAMARRIEKDYSPFDDDLTGYEGFYDEFIESTSPEETMMIKQMIDNNMDLRKNLEDYGGVRFAAGLVDPINLVPVPFAIGQGFVTGAKQAMKYGLPLVGATEITRHLIDPTSTKTETAFNTLGGTLFMGLMGGAVGKLPKNGPTVSDVLNKMIPPAGTTMMFAGIPWAKGSPKGIFKGIADSLRSVAGSGELLSKTVDPDSLTIHTDESFPGRKLVVIRHDEGGDIVTAWEVDGELQIGVEVPENMRRKGIASASIMKAIKYAEDNGLRVTSYNTVSKDALGMWSHFEELGFKVDENKNFNVDPDGTRVSTNDKPLFRLLRQVDDAAEQVPPSVRAELNELKGARLRHQAELKAVDDAIKVAKEKLKTATKAGGWKTRRQRELDDLLETKKNTEALYRIAKTAETDRNVQVAGMLDEKTVKDWDLLPTGYNKLLGKLDQFPWWTLMKTPFRELAPDLAVKYQKFALKMAATPGLNNAGNRLDATTGPSIESLVIEYTGKWISVTRDAQRIYRKYAGYGETSSQIKQFMVDQAQRVRSSANRALGGERITTTADGKLTIQEFNRQISIAIVNKGKHEVPEVAEAASGYIRVLDEIGTEGKNLGVFATQVNIQKRINKVQAGIEEFNTKFGDRYQVKPSDLAAKDAKYKEGKDSLDFIEKVRAQRQEVTDSKVDGPEMTPTDGVHDVYIEFYFNTPHQETRRVEIYRNPTRRGLMRWAKKQGIERVRFATDREGHLYVWDAEAALHDDLLTQGLPIPDHGGIGKDGGELPKDLFDMYQRELTSQRDLLAIEKEQGGESIIVRGQEISDDNLGLIGIPNRALDEAELRATALIDESMKLDKEPLPPGLQNGLDNLELEKMQLEETMQSYIDAEGDGYMHRMWQADEVIAQEVELKQMLTESFQANPKLVIKDADGNVKPEHPDVVQGRVNEAYASILHDAQTGGDSLYAPNSTNKRDWLEGRLDYLNDNPDGLPPRTVNTQIKIIENKLERIAQGSNISGAAGPLIARRLQLDDQRLIEMGLIEGDVTSWMNHYVMRTAPIIETARVFGDGRAQKHIDELIEETYLAAKAEKDPKKQARMLEEMERASIAMNDLRDIVHGVWQIPDNTDAITPRLLRMLRNFNILGSMGRSVFMAMGDIGNVVVSQGFRRSLGHAVEHYAAGLNDGNIKMMRDEVDLAGSVSEVILGMRYHQMTDFGAAIAGSGKLAKMERSLANASQRFFLWNLLGPWTDMARRFSGGMLQSRLIEYSRLWKAGTLGQEERTIMGRLGISKAQAVQFVEEWEASGSLKHKSMFIANTDQWLSKNAKSVFRAAMNTEINRMVPTPGAVDKPKALLKSEWWKVIGQYRGFSIAATHRIMGAGLHTKGRSKYSGMASMVGIAMMVDSLKRPDYMQMPIEEQLLRAVELSAVTGIILDFNDTIERASAGTIGLRPALGMEIRERNPNWANRMGTIGAVPNQWLTLMYGLTSDDATTNDLARGVRYMIPYNNLLWWNEAFNRVQRSSVDFIERED